MKNDTSTRLSNQERWELFINELNAYIEEHHLGPSKHTTLYNQCWYFKRSFDKAQEPLSPKMAERKRQLDEVLSMRDLSIHTGGRRKLSNSKIDNL